LLHLVGYLYTYVENSEPKICRIVYFCTAYAALCLAGYHAMRTACDLLCTLQLRIIPIHPIKLSYSVCLNIFLILSTPLC
jgi:hypothetical protein